jgi:uptake hydrogenase large subunit
MSELVVGPFNRVEGDLEVRLAVDDGQVTAAYVNSPLFRGFERMLEGKDPRDALTLTPRICGICSISQSAAAARALAEAEGIVPVPMGEIATALIHAVENMADHLTHFYMFFMPDFARQAYAGRPWQAEVADRFTAMQGSGQRQALDARVRLLHVMGILAGKWPHTLAIQPGGVTRAPGATELTRIGVALRSFRRFLEAQVLGGPVEDFAALGSVGDLWRWDRGDAGLFLRIAEDLGLIRSGRGLGNYLSFGAYPLPEGYGFAPGVRTGGAVQALDPARIAEDLSHAWMLGATTHPFDGATLPDEDMRAEAYSWCKAPRYGGRVMETGALARQVLDHHPLALDLADQHGGGGVLGRVAGRLLELARSQILIEDLLARLSPDAPYMARGATRRRNGQGAGLVEAARGALGHWLKIENGRIVTYQIIAPTTWNFSPRDGGGVPGALESALVGAVVGEGETAPLAVQHIVRSFDPCMVCTVH